MINLLLHRILARRIRFPNLRDHFDEETEMPLAVRLPSIDSSSRKPVYLDVMDRKKTAVQRQLRRAGLGGYEPEFLSTMLAFGSTLPKGFVFYDIGSHIGLYSALLEKLFRTKATAFEATPETAKDCRRLRSKNNLTYRVVNAAISNTEGEIDLFLSPKAETSNSLNKDFRPGATAIKVPMTTIDLFASDGDYPSLMKVDVETYEPQVLLGAMETIRKARPVIACEILPQTDSEKLLDALRALAELGYFFYHVSDQPVWQPVGFGEVESRLDHERRDWVFTPEELTPDFFQARSKWANALLDCGQETNIITSSNGDEHPAEKRISKAKKSLVARVLKKIFG